MKKIDKDISDGQLKQMYLLYGDEAFLKKRYRNKLRDAFLPDGDTLNLSYFEGAGTSVRDIIDTAETLPFLSERRLIIVENSGFFKTSKPELADYLKQAPETAAFIFVENEADKRGKLYKAVAAGGYAVEISAQTTDTLTKWVAVTLRNEGKTTDRRTVEYFIGKCGSDMSNLEMEMEKLFCYTMGRNRITIEDIDAVCVTRISNHIFDMVDAVSRMDRRKALSLYFDLLALKEPPARILYLISRQFRIMLQVADMSALGRNRDEIAKSAGIPSFTISKYLKSARNFTTARLREAMTECAELEEAVKTGRINDQLSVELLIVKYSDGKRA